MGNCNGVWCPPCDTSSLVIIRGDDRMVHIRSTPNRRTATLCCIVSCGISCVAMACCPPPQSHLDEWIFRNDGSCEWRRQWSCNEDSGRLSGVKAAHLVVADDRSRTLIVRCNDGTQQTLATTSDNDRIASFEKVVAALNTMLTSSKTVDTKVSAPRGSILAPVASAEEKKQLLPRVVSDQPCASCATRTAVMICGACWAESRGAHDIQEPTTPGGAGGSPVANGRTSGRFSGTNGSPNGNISPQLVARHMSARGDKLANGSNIRHEATMVHVCSYECMSRLWHDGHHSQQHKWMHTSSPQPRSPPSPVDVYWSVRHTVRARKLYSQTMLITIYSGGWLWNGNGLSSPPLLVYRNSDGTITGTVPLANIKPKDIRLGDWSPELAEARRSGRPAATLMLLKWSRHTQSDDTTLSPLLSAASLPPLSPLTDLSMEMQETRRTEFVARVPVLQRGGIHDMASSDDAPSSPSLSSSFPNALPFVPLLGETNSSPLDLVLSPLMMAGGSGGATAATPSSIDHYGHSKDGNALYSPSPAPLLGALPNQPMQQRYSDPSMRQSSSDASISHSLGATSNGHIRATSRDRHGGSNGGVTSPSAATTTSSGSSHTHAGVTSHAVAVGLTNTTIHIPTSSSTSSLALLHDTDAASNDAGTGRRASHHRRRSSGNGGTAAQIIGTTESVLMANGHHGRGSFGSGSGGAVSSPATAPLASASGGATVGIGRRSVNGKILRVDAHPSFDPINTSFDGLPTPSSLSQVSDI